MYLNVAWLSPLKGTAILYKSRTNCTQTFNRQLNSQHATSPSRIGTSFFILKYKKITITYIYQLKNRKANQRLVNYINSF